MIDALLIILNYLIAGFLASAIITTLISQHIETYCNKIGIDISPLNEKSLLGTPVPPNENRKILEKYTSKLQIIYTFVAALVIAFIYK